MAITTVSIEEIEYGLSLLVSDVKLRTLRTKFETFAAEVAIVEFGHLAAIRCAEIRARRRQGGRPIGLADAQIAGMVMASGATLSTRNTRDFEGCGIELVNPWHGEI